MNKILDKRSNKLISIIQARMSSKRLPGKVLFDLGSSNVLGQVIKRAKYFSDKVVVCTSDKKEDNKIADYCMKMSEKVQKQSKQITAELKILNFMNSKTVDLKGEVSNDFMNMLKKSKVKPKLRIITTKKEKKNDTDKRRRT